MVGTNRWLVLRDAVEARIAAPLSTCAPPADEARSCRPVITRVIGADRHKRERQLAIKAEDGTITDRHAGSGKIRQSNAAPATIEIRITDLDPALLTVTKSPIPHVNADPTAHPARPFANASMVGEFGHRPKRPKPPP